MENELVSKLKEKFKVLTLNSSEIKEKVKIASGGFGTVYKSKYKNQNIALKDPNDNEKIIQLEKEITNIKGLRHIYIPKLYGITNSPNSTHGASLIIEYIKGCTFTSYLKYTPSQIEIVTHLLDLVTTLEYLHKNGVIHRDIKPDNLMINLESMSCILLDFGISKKTLHDTTNTVVVGTPLYMAPENFDIVFGTGASMRMDSIMKISPKVDVWALGVMINQIFSGEDPWAKYKGTDVSVLFLKGIRFPVSDKIRDDDIRQLISSCTEPLPYKRCSISFAKNQLMKILNKFCAKFQYEDILNNYFEKSKNKGKLYYLIHKKIEKYLRFFYYTQNIEKENIKHLIFNNVFTLNKHLSPITGLIYIKDYDKFSIISISMDKTMLVWDFTTGKLKKEFKKHTGGLTSIIHIRDLGNSKAHVAVGSEDKKIYIWDLNKGNDKPAYELCGHSGSVDKLLYLREFSADLLASGSRDKSIKLWKINGNKCLHTMIGHNDSITSLLYMASYINVPNSKNIIISASADKSIKSWSLVKGKQEKTFTGAFNHTGEITCLIDIYKFKDKSDVFATGSKDGTIKLWEYFKESCLSTIQAHEKGVNVMIGLKEYDTSWIASGGADNFIKIWDIYKDSPYQNCLHGHEGEITCLIYLKEVNIELIASGSSDGTIKIWNFVQYQLLLSLDDHNSKINFLIYLDGYIPPTMISSCSKNLIKIWNISNN